MIIEEFLLVHELYHDTYDKPKAWIKMNNGFTFPTIGSITLPLKVGLKKIDFSFSIIPTSDQFHVKIGYPWPHSKESILLIVHKCLEFLFDNEIFIVHHSGFNPMSSHGKFFIGFILAQTY